MPIGTYLSPTAESFRVVLAVISHVGVTQESSVGNSCSMIQNSFAAREASVQLNTVPAEPLTVVRVYPITCTTKPENAAADRVRLNCVLTSRRSILPLRLLSTVPLKITELIFCQPGHRTSAGAVIVTLGGTGM